MTIVPLPLPRVQHPVFPLLVPSFARAARFRPFTVKEEKILLMAKESDEPAVDHLRAIHQVVGNCCQEDVEGKLATFDLEWLFLKLRAASVGPSVEKSFVDVEERDSGKFTEETLPVYTFTIRLDDVKAPVVPEPSGGFALPNGTVAHRRISLDSGDGVCLRYPPAELYMDEAFTKNAGDAILYRSTVEVFTRDSAFDTRNFTQEEVVEYYDGWATSDMELVRGFLDSTPTMSHEIPYVNSFGNAKTVRLTSLSDFFTF